MFLSPRYNALAMLGIIASLNSTVQAQDLWRLYQSAQQQNSNWSAQQYDYLANRQNEALAHSDLLPQVGLQGKLQYDYFKPSEHDGDGTTTAQLGVGVRQPLFRLDRWKNYEKAAIASGIQGIQLLEQRQDLTEQVIKAYLGVLRAQAMTESLNAEYVALKAQDDMMQARLAQGVVARVDTEETRAALENVRALLANNDVAILTATQQLSLLTGQAINEVDQLKQPMTAELVAPKSIDTWLAQAQSHNLSIQLAQANVLLAKKQQEITHVNRYPQLDLVGNLGYQKQVSDNDNPAASLASGINYGIGVELSLPLYTGGRIDSAATQAAYQTEAAINRAGFAQRAAMTQTSQAYLNLMAQKATINARQVAVEANAKVAQASKAGYDLGMRSMVDRLLAERQYHAARRDLITAYFEYLSAYVDLQKATGNLGDNTVQVIDRLLVSQ